MRKAFTLLLIIVWMVAGVLIAEAQQPAKVPSRIGFLGATSSTANAPLRDAFRQGLHELGYVEGANIIIEYRHADGRSERFPELAAELVRLKVDVIVTGAVGTTKAAQQATSTIPIVMANIGADPVGMGLVTSLARPGGNVTGLTNIAPELSPKRLELLKEAFPRVSRIAVFRNPTNPSHEVHVKEIEVTARALGLRLQPVEVQGPGDFDKVFSAITKERAHALLTIPDPLINLEERRIADFAAKSRLPAMYHRSEAVDAGGLMAYGANYVDLFRRAASYVDRILKGAKPADLPVERPTKFELIINLKTAKALGVKIPAHLLMEADKVID